MLLRRPLRRCLRRHAQRRRVVHFPPTLIRHAATVGPLTISVVRPAFRALLMASSRSPQAFPTSFCRTGATAVGLSAVAVRADVKQLSAAAAALFPMTSIHSSTGSRSGPVVLFLARASIRAIQALHGADYAAHPKVRDGNPWPSPFSFTLLVYAYRTDAAPPVPGRGSLRPGASDSIGKLLPFTVGRGGGGAGGLFIQS